MKRLQTLSFICFLAAVVIAGCKKKDSDYHRDPEMVAHFTNKSSGNYIISTPTTTYKIPIGITNPTNKPTTINVTVTSPTGAVQGTHYTLSSTSVTIPAGKTIDSIEVKGIQSQYLAGRKDTLVFTIQESGAKPAPYNNKFTLAMRGPCFQGEINNHMADLLGNYNNSNELLGSSAYGPYQTKITAVNQLTPTTGTITVSNIFDAGWGPITFLLDWTDPANSTVTLSQQSGIGNAGTINSAYNGQDISVRPFAGQTGTFSYCNQTLTLKMQLGVTGVGWFGSLYTLNMAR